MLSIWQRDYGTWDVLNVPSGDYRVTVQNNGDESAQGRPRDDPFWMTSSMGDIVFFATPYTLFALDPGVVQALLDIHAAVHSLVRHPRAVELLRQPNHGAYLRTLGRDLENAVRHGWLRVEPLHRPRPIVEREEKPAQENAPHTEQEEWIRILLFDSAGKAIPSDLHGVSATVDVSLSGGKKYEKKPVSGGRTDVEGIPPGTASGCTVAFAGFAEGSDRVPAEAPPRHAVEVEKALARGPLEKTTFVTRRELAKPQRASLGCTNVFQLRRRNAEVVELEHFAKDGVLLWPGQAPDDVKLREGAKRIGGFEALRACVDLAQGSVESMRITAHGEKLAKERAQCVTALLVGDAAARKAWVNLADAHGGVKDQQAILQWAALQFGWACDPGAIDGNRGATTQRALEGFARGYNGDRNAGLFSSDHPALATDGNVTRETWGAMFDCFERALFRSTSEEHVMPAYVVVDDRQETYPARLAKIAAPGGDENRWRDLNPLNPSMLRPKGKGWYPPQVGQRIYVPADWDLGALGAAGYETHTTGEASATTSAKGQPLPSPGPTVVACGTHHPKAPFEKTRRAEQRCIEVIFFDEGEVPEAICTTNSPAPCTAKTCELYDPREYELEYDLEHFDVFLDPKKNEGDANESYRLVAKDGSYDRTVERTRAVVAGEQLALRFFGVKPGLRYDLFKICGSGNPMAIHRDFSLSESGDAS